MVGWRQVAVGRWQVTVLPLFLYLSLFYKMSNEKIKYGASFIRQFLTEYAVGIPSDFSVRIFKNFEFLLHPTQGQKKFLKFFIFRRNIPLEIPPEPEFRRNIQKKIYISPLNSE